MRSPPAQRVTDPANHPSHGGAHVGALGGARVGDAVFLAPQRKVEAEAAAEADKQVAASHSSCYSACCRLLPLLATCLLLLLAAAACCCLLPLLATCYLLLATCYLLLATCLRPGSVHPLKPKVPGSPPTVVLGLVVVVLPLLITSARAPAAPLQAVQFLARRKVAHSLEQGSVNMARRSALLRSWATFQAPSQTRMSHSAC